MKIIGSVIVFAVFGVTFFCSAQVAVNKSPNDAAYEKNLIQAREPLAYSNIRESDAVWVKRIWRNIDLRERMNQPFYFPLAPSNNMRNLMQVLLDAIAEGKITAYDAKGETDEFLIAIPPNDLIQNLKREVTREVPDPNDPQQMTQIKVTIDFKTSNVTMFRIKEDWIFDKQRSVFEPRIIGICPVIIARNPITNDFEGYDQLFWIYFPEARSVLAKAEAFNFYNSSQRLSYDDIFHKRIFSSYIYKEDNVYGRVIGEYATGLDALLESERIKDGMFRWETDLWEY